MCGEMETLSQSQEVENTGSSSNSKGDEDKELFSVNELRSAPLKKILQSCVVEHVAAFYQVAAVRVLVKDGELWKVRQIFEEKLRLDGHIVGFFSCPTALEQKKNGQKIRVPGLSFWVIFDFFFFFFII